MLDLFTTWTHKIFHLSMLDMKLVKFSVCSTLVFSFLFAAFEYSFSPDHEGNLIAYRLISTAGKNFLTFSFYSVVMFLFFKKEISNPLKKISRFLLSNNHPELRYRKLTIGDRETCNNEIDICVEAINTMNSNLYQGCLSLEKYREELEMKVREKTNKLKAAGEERRILISILCHDMSNFLTIIDLTTKLIKNNDETNEKTKGYYIKRLEKSTRAIMEVLQNVKDMEAMKLGVKNINLTHINLNDTISDMLFFFKDKIERKQLRIKLENLLEEDDLVIAEATSLSHQVLSNIMSNAIKFSEENSLITISLRKTKDQSIRVTIKDSGIGIPENDIDNIFRLEKYSSRSGTSGESGTGFGIPIAKSFIEKYGGKLSVESKCKEKYPNNHGSAFHIDLRKAA